MQKPYLIIDNHPAHKSYAVRDLYKNFHILFTPAYSSFLNPQETVWSILKRELAISYQQRRRDIKSQDELVKHVDKVLRKVQKNHKPTRLVFAAREEF